MKRKVAVAAVWLAVSTAAHAGEPAPLPPVAAEARSEPAIGHVAAGALVRIETAEMLGSATHFKGNTFAIRLVAPIVSDGAVLLPAGTMGVGEIISSGHPGPGGLSGKLVLAARYLEYNGRRIPLYDLRLTARGKDNDLRPVLKKMEYASPAARFADAVLPGEDVVIKEGTAANARLASEIDLPVLARATPAEIAAARPIPDLNPELDARLAAPPPGKAQIVFFRGALPSTAWTSWAIWENDAMISSLGNGSYFVLVVDPGPHTFATGMSGDKLTLEPAAGGTYYIEQAAIQYSFTPEPVLYPSDETAFQQLPTLKLAKPAKRKS